MVDLEDDIEDVESVNILQEQKLNIMETDMSDNENDIEGFYSISPISLHPL